MRWFVLIFCLGVLNASAGTAGVVDALAQGRLPDETERAGVGDEPEGLFLLGWLAEGRYGQPADHLAAAGYFQRSAEAGFVAAARYCWGRCIENTPELREAIEKGAQRGDPDALYLQYLAAAESGGGEVDQLLLMAARRGHHEAIGQLYADHFLNWVAGNRTPRQAAQKLARCRQEGIVYCYYLEGAMSRRFGDHENALYFLQQLRWIDAELFAKFLDTADLEQLIIKLPQQNAVPVFSRAALALSAQADTGNPRIDRFRYCDEEASTACVVRLAARDEACFPEVLAKGEMASFRQTAGYRACLSAAGDGR